MGTEVTIAVSADWFIACRELLHLARFAAVTCRNHESSRVVQAQSSFKMASVRNME